MKANVNIDLTQILITGLSLLATYKRGRDQVQEKADPTDPTTGELKTDAQLIELMRMDGQDLVSHIDEILAKHPQPAQPDPPTGG